MCCQSPPDGDSASCGHAWRRLVGQGSRLTAGVQGAAADCQTGELTAALEPETRRLRQRLAQRAAAIEVRAGMTWLVPAGGLLLPTGHDRLEGSAHGIYFLYELMTKYFTGNRLNRYQIFKL